MRQLLKPALTLIVTVLAIVAVAGPAGASHSVNWGVDTPSGPRQIIAAESPTNFVVTVDFDGIPLADWPMSAVTTDAAGNTVTEQAFSTDGSGIAEFSIDAPAPGESVTVVLCDEDGCLYGEASISGPVIAVTTDAPTSAPPSSASPATTAAASSTGGDSNIGWWVLIGVGVVLAMLGAFLLGNTLLSSKHSKTFAE